jgi:hypothetical protein
MTTERDMTPKERKWMAAVFFFFGLFVLAMALGWIKTKPSADHAPLWVLISAGMVFNLGGVMILLVGKPGVDTLRNLVTWLFVLSLALPFNWIAFGEGERHFSSSVSVGGVSTHESADERTGRLVFGLFAGLMDFMLVWPIVRVLRGKPAFLPQQDSGQRSP